MSTFFLIHITSLQEILEPIWTTTSMNRYFYLTILANSFVEDKKVVPLFKLSYSSIQIKNLKDVI